LKESAEGRRESAVGSGQLKRIVCSEEGGDGIYLWGG